MGKDSEKRRLNISQNKVSLSRKPGQRESYEIVLIIFEGKKSEPYYFTGLLEDRQLDKGNIHISACKRGTDPMSIVNEALEYNKDREFDRVYCVFDKEQSTYQAALNKVQDYRNNGHPIYAITSVPCFEYWLLLHFIETTKQYRQKGRKSSGDQIKSELKKYIKDYHVGDKDIFGKTKEHLQKAIDRAKRLQQENDTDDPSTKIYELVEYLLSLKR